MVRYKYDLSSKSGIDEPTVIEALAMVKIFQGIVHGRTIEVVEDLGVEEGQIVEVQVKVVPITGGKHWGDGLRRSAGALADEWTDEDDKILNEIYEERKRDTRREIPE